eukprot:3884801-Lingulodinium_polyedra.AAC.1
MLGCRGGNAKHGRRNTRPWEYGYRVAPMVRPADCRRFGVLAAHRRLQTFQRAGGIHASQR